MSYPELNTVKEIVVYKSALGKWITAWVFRYKGHIIRYEGPDQVEALRIAKHDGEACNLAVVDLDGNPL